MEARRTDKKRSGQLQLIPGDVGGPTAPAPWPLDPTTRARGLEGVAAARRALEGAQPPEERLRRAS